MNFLANPLFKMKIVNTQDYHLLITLLHFTIFCVLEVTCCICVVEILHEHMLLHISSHYPSLYDVTWLA